MLPRSGETLTTGFSSPFCRTLRRVSSLSSASKLIERGEAGGRAVLGRDVEIFDLGVVPSTLDLGVTISAFDLGDMPGEAGRESTKVGEGANSRLMGIITVGLVIDDGLTLAVAEGSLFSVSSFLLLGASPFFFSLITCDRRLSYLWLGRLSKEIVLLAGLATVC